MRSSRDMPTAPQTMVAMQIHRSAWSVLCEEMRLKGKWQGKKNLHRRP